MLKWLSLLLKKLFGESIARGLGGAGLSLVSSAAVLPLVTTALNAGASAIGGAGGNLLNVALLFGLGECISIVGSAMLTRVAIQSVGLGIKRASSAS